MTTKNREKKEDKADEFWDKGKNPEFHKEDKADEYKPPKSNEKLDRLWDDVAAKWNELDKFLTVQGLGQGNRQRVVKLVNELDVIKTKILEEKE